jgi:N-carbamoylputrescine amidase
MTMLKVGVCEGAPELVPGSSEWNILCQAVSRESPDLFLLNEMPFGPWISAGQVFHQETWNQSCVAHEQGIRCLAELGATVVAGSRPHELDGRRVNDGFIWTMDEGVKSIHTKQYFPDEEGYYEARWFHAGERHFRVAPAGRTQCGFLICTELMFNERARQYGRNGAEVILVPRAVGKSSLERWLVATRMAAIVSGAYVLSSNRVGVDSQGQTFGGSGWVVNSSGDLVAQTSSATPVVFAEIDTQSVARAQREYPCYVME